MDFNEQEKKILEFWKANSIFEKSLRKDAPKGSFVFYEGPPTANGKPGIHHVEARAFKDLIPRFKTMQGFKVERKAGWDTHGLPVELEVEKQLGLKNKKDIEDYGIEGFNKNCKESVWKYKEDWEKMTERIGFWVDMNNPYSTYENYYIETLWWIIKQAHEKDLLYKGHKVIPNCPRCGTALSSHEVAQGYKKVEEDSIYVKFKLKGRDSEYILAWTTTPWTLPGNVALAVGGGIEYVKIKQNKEFYYLAKNLLEKIDGEYEIAEEMKGKDLIGFEYEPLFEGAIPKDTENYKNAFKIYPADFVSTEEGTGVVHTAVMYGVDDYELGEKIGLPKIHTVNLDGTFNELVSKWQGKFVKDVEKEITNDLRERGLLRKTEKYSHDYPFCWRCDTPLIYYAKDSWYFKMTQLKKDLIKNNEQINWIPEHIKEGRFGEWLNEVKDWAISRERYWGTPMPIWQCEKCEEIKVVGSIDEIKKDYNGLNKLFLIRHGEAESNVKWINNSLPETEKYPLTKKGREQAEVIAKSFKKEKIDLIFSSPVLRAKETAEIIGDKLGLEVVFDKRLREIDLGEFNNKNYDELHEAYPSKESRVSNTKYGVESGVDVRKRLEEFLGEINEKYQGKNIAVISHGDPVQIFYGLARGLSLEDSFEEWYPQTGAVKSVYSKPFDLHRPYIDEVKLECECGAKMKRIPEVMDCWFDSGAMPFAQIHYPFENKELIDEGVSFPADFIAEAVDQTRGWFYTLLAVSTLLGKGPPYKNVISLGHLLDKNGKKMSKSLGNIVDPAEMVEKYGADTVRWYLYTVNQPGDPVLFDEKGLKESRRMFMTIMNVLTFYKMFTNESSADSSQLSENVLDKWILSKLNLLIEEVTGGLEKYDITSSARKIEEFVTDLSQWYVRRSRERFKGEDKHDKMMAQRTLRDTLITLSKLIAPFAPFVSEYIYGELKGGEESACGDLSRALLRELVESVHLENYPSFAKASEGQARLLEEMDLVREDVSVGLDLRLKAGIKVRQPLSLFETPNEFSDEMKKLIQDELNVKRVKKGEGYKLDMNITSELKKEGLEREFIRAFQDVRKKDGRSSGEELTILHTCSDIGDVDIKKIQLSVNAKLIKFDSSLDDGHEVKAGSKVFKAKTEK